MKFIGEEAFYWCSELKDFEVLAVTPPTVYANSFDHDGYYRYKRIRLWVPYESQDEYKKHEVWGHFDTIGVIKTAIDENTIDDRDTFCTLVTAICVFECAGEHPSERDIKTAYEWAFFGK